MVSYSKKDIRKIPKEYGRGRPHIHRLHEEYMKSMKPKYDGRKFHYRKKIRDYDQFDNRYVASIYGLSSKIL